MARPPRPRSLPALACALPAGVLAAVMAFSTAAFAIPIVEFPLPSRTSGPAEITGGPDGNIWFLEVGASKVGRVTPAGAIDGEEALKAGVFLAESPAGITTGPDGNVWFTEPMGNNIGRITPKGALAELPVPSPIALPTGIALGPDGNLWFTEYNHGKIGRVTPAGTFTEFPLPSSTAGPIGITSGPDGNLWFTETGANQIARITPGGTITELPSPVEPYNIALGADGNLWFTELFGKNVGRMTPTGTVTEFPLSAAAAFITAGPDGSLWFTEPQNDAIGRITTAGVVTEYTVPTANAQPLGITAGSDGNLWFAEANAGQIGRLTPPCGPGATTLCLDDQTGDRRFQVTVTFSTTEGGGASGKGHAIPLASLGVFHGGLFWFFSADNPEMLIKVLDACTVNQRFWVFTSAGTNVGFVVTVKDTRNGNLKIYRNPDGTAAPPVQDTAALPCS